MAASAATVLGRAGLRVDDLHVHLRQGALMRAVTPLLEAAGVRTALVMPNLRPPITSTAQALAYRDQLQALAPSVLFLMTLYLTPELTPDEVRKAAAAGIVGVKSYPRGVTTNSDSGIEDYDRYFPVFEAMQDAGLVLNLHGEVPSDADKGTCVLNAEERFLPQLERLHARFPRLRIVLEHASTRAAVDAVRRLGDTVAASITLHHLDLVVDHWAADPHNYCKPVAKFPDDRDALREVIKE
ncbi:Dihydroorotase, partial [Cladochytrium tenue]